MNRCAPALLLGALLLGSFSVVAQMPHRVPPIPGTAERGWFQVVAPPLVQLNGQAERLAPGARIRGTTNLLQMSASLVGQTLAVAYVRDTQGLLHEVWILTEGELRADGAN